MRMADILMAAMLEGSDDPKTYKKAMLLLDAGDWVEACAKEVAPLVENGVYEVSNLSCTPWEKWTGAKPDSSQPPTAAAGAADLAPAPPADPADPAAAVKPLPAV